jgi:hypothetical protein
MINPRQTPRRPNLFILGAAKCGTTSLWHYLRQHPDIFMSAWKEPSLFSDTYNAVPNIVDYMDIFAAAGDRKVVGEASVAYLPTARAPAALQAFCPDAKYLVILRHPADRAYSLYHHMRYRGHEFAPTFELALRLENFRMGRPRFWSHATHIPWNFLYFTSGLFGRQISRYLEFIPRERFYFSEQLRFAQEHFAGEFGVAKICVIQFSLHKASNFLEEKVVEGGSKCRR